MYRNMKKKVIIERLVGTKKDRKSTEQSSDNFEGQKGQMISTEAPTVDVVRDRNQT